MSIFDSQTWNLTQNTTLKNNGLHDYLCKILQRAGNVHTDDAAVLTILYENNFKGARKNEIIEWRVLSNALKDSERTLFCVYYLDESFDLIQHTNLHNCKA